jgi:hypothetical protein
MGFFHTVNLEGIIPQAPGFYFPLRVAGDFFLCFASYDHKNELEKDLL